MNSNMNFQRIPIVYHYANYDYGGLLIEAYLQEGQQGLIKIFNSSEFKKCMYYGGQCVENDVSSNQTSLPMTQDLILFYKEPTKRKACWKRHLRGYYGESLLHVLIICNTRAHIQISKCLASFYPNLVHDVFETSEYSGVSSLHLSIIYRCEELTDLLLELKADVNQRAIGSFIRPSNLKDLSCFRGKRYYGEYPLSWAAGIDDKKVYNSLINAGADPNLVDFLGNTVLHVIVICERLMTYGFVVNHPIRTAKIDIPNNFGLTPIALACVLGKSKIFREIIELSCKEFWTYSIITCCGYPLSVVDSMQMESADTKGRSALTIILEGNKNEHLEMLKGGVIQKLLEEKWKTFGHRQFIKKILRTFLHLLILSLAIFLRRPESISHECENEVKKYFRILSEVFTCISCTRQILIQIKEFMNSGNLNFLINLRNSLPRTSFLISNILILTCMLCRIFGENMLEETLLVFALPCSWFVLIFFAAAVRLTGPFVSMIRYMIIQDMRQFSIIYLVFLYGFSQVFFFLLKRPLQKHIKASNHATYYESWMELFRMTLGAHEYEELRQSYYHWLTQFFFVLFMILMPILLLNMLIAMMGNTYSLVISQSEREWTMQWAKTLLDLEKALSKKEAQLFLSQYTINLAANNEKPLSALMVIKKMKTSKAKQRRGAIANWKRLKIHIRMLIKNQNMSLSSQL